MQIQTTATLQQLDRIEWFSSVGITNSQVVITVSSWQEAIEHCASIDWENLCLEAVNQYRERIGEISPERLTQWNSIIEEVKKITIPLCRKWL